MISIPLGAIKSMPFISLTIVDPISIPLGAIKSLFLLIYLPGIFQISIPLGAIKSILLKV